MFFPISIERNGAATTNQPIAFIVFSFVVKFVDVLEVERQSTIYRSRPVPKNYFVHRSSLSFRTEYVSFWLCVLQTRHVALQLELCGFLRNRHVSFLSERCDV